MKRFLSLALVLAAVVSAGCAGTIKNMRELPEDAVVPTPSPNEALVVFMRPSGVAFGVQSSVFEVSGGKPALVGIVAAKAKVVHAVSPGKHLFMVVGESGDFMSADLAAGKTYYALVEPRLGAWKARFSLAPVTREMLGTPEFDDWFSACRLVERSPESDTWALENANSIQARYTKYYPKWMEKAAGDRPNLKSDDGR